MDVTINYLNTQSTPVKYNFPKHYKGDTLDQINFTIQEDGTPVDLTGVQILTQFKVKAKDNTSVLQLSTASGLTLTDAANGIYSIDPFILDIKTGTYIYDAQFTFIDGRVKTYHCGNLPIVQDITRATT